MKVRKALAFIVFWAVFVEAQSTRAQPRDARPWDDLGANAAAVFCGTNLIWHGGAVVSTVVMAESGLDYDIRVFAQNHIHAKGYADTALYGGYVLPIILAPSIYALGIAGGDRKTVFAGAASIQALFVSGVTTGLLKWGTGRPFPNNGRSPDDPYKLEHREEGRIGAFAPFGANIFMAWPSGHTSSTMSIAAALYGFAPESSWTLYLGYPLAMAIGFGMVVGDHHWASDVVAGAMIGHAVGYSTGRNFRRSFDGGKETADRVGIRIQGVQAVPVSSGMAVLVFGSL